SSAEGGRSLANMGGSCPKTRHSIGARQERRKGHAGGLRGAGGHAPRPDRFPNHLKFTISVGRDRCRRDPRGSLIGAIVARGKRITTRRAQVGGQEPCLFASPHPAGTGGPGALDAQEILASIGEAAYEWHIEGDVLIWGANAGAVLRGIDPAALARGSSYGALVDPGEGRSRAGAVLDSSGRDDGAGVPYETQYKLRGAGAGEPVWIEDSGRWFAGPDGKAVRAHGVVRVINERREQERRLAYLAHFDPLTGEANHWRLTEILQTTIEQAVKLRSSCGFLLAAIDNLNQINQAYGFEVVDEVIVAVAQR